MNTKLWLARIRIEDAYGKHYHAIVVEGADEGEAEANAECGAQEFIPCGAVGLRRFALTVKEVTR
jgi:hypothetical protein